MGHSRWMTPPLKNACAPRRFGSHQRERGKRMRPVPVKRWLFERRCT